MNLHLTRDDKFLDNFIDICESIDSPDNNIYIAHRSRFQNRLEYIKNKKVIFAKYGTLEFYSAVGNISKYERVFIHLLNEDMCDFVLRIPPQAKIYWLFWGADFYTPVEYFADFLFDSDTKKYIRNKSRIKFIASLWPSKIIALKRRTAARINYFCHYNMLDHKIVMSAFKTKACFLPFFYPPFYNFKKFDFETDHGLLKDKYRKGAAKLVLLGNSGFPTGNHLDMLEKLSYLNKKSDFKVLCPLSYGDRGYIQYLTRKASAILGDRFLPITEFLKEEMYFNLLRHIDIILMNQNRTQGGSSIAAALYFGKKVYMKKGNTLCRLLGENGISVFDIEADLKNTQGCMDNELSAEAKDKNRRSVSELFSNEKAVENIRRMLSS